MMKTPRFSQKNYRISHEFHLNLIWDVINHTLLASCLFISREIRVKSIVAIFGIFSKANSFWPVLRLSKITIANIPIIENFDARCKRTLKTEANSKSH